MELIVLSTILAVLIHSSSCQNLVATQVNKLPHNLYEHASLYDGNDTIFILGGTRQDVLESNVYSYSIVDNDIKEVAKFPRYVDEGFATFDDKGDILYMGGSNVFGNNDGNIYKVERSNWNLSIVKANQTFGDCRGVKPMDGSNTLLIPARVTFEGPGFMFCLDLSTFESCENTQGIPLLTNYYRPRPFLYEGHIYLIGSGPSGFVEKVNVKTLESELFNVSLPFLSQHDVVFDGTYAYIIGVEEVEGSAPHGIIRFNPQNMQHEFFPVEDFPVNYTNPDSHWAYGSAVYVEKLNRIYFSGGLTYDGIGTPKNEIWYIDLAPINK